MSSGIQRLKPRNGYRTGQLIAALDIGCSKIACLIGRVDPSSRSGFRLIGGGRQQSRGFNGGAITDMDALERAIRIAVEEAEREAGERIDRVILGIAGPRVTSELAEAEISFRMREVAPRDITKVCDKALGTAALQDRHLLGAYSVMYGLDDEDDIRKPTGLVAERLRVLLNVISAPEALVQNLCECVQRAHLSVERIVASSIASGSGALIADEVENGSLCIDIGAGVTSISAFINGAPAWVDLVKVGGAHVTADIAQGIGTTLAAAERLKTIYGTCATDASHLAERIDAPRLGDDGRLSAARMSRHELAAIITPRLEEIFELIEKRIKVSDLRPILPRRTVLTGGTSQLPGIKTLAESVLKRPVRLGNPVDGDVLGEKFNQPGFSTAAGLINSQLKELSDTMPSGSHKSEKIRGELSFGRKFVSRILLWIRENF